jgi:uncharacterized protein YndB with AHSA1/START domain
MEKPIVAKVETTIEAPPAEVWEALVTPETIKQYMFGATVRSDWKEGSPITWKGEWKGKPYEDRGVILDIEPGRRLEYSHYSPLSGLPDTPENHHTVRIELAPRNDRNADKTLVTLTQDNNPDEEARKHSEKNWSMMLDGMKRVVES